MPWPFEGVYVRAFILCNRIEREPDNNLALRGCIRHLPLVRRLHNVPFTVKACVIAERNGDTAPHEFRVYLMGPNAERFSKEEAKPLPPDDAIMMEMGLVLTIPYLIEGQYRLVLELDGVPVGYAPIELHLVNANAN